MARKGYVNLLLPRHTGAGDPGDSREMLQSRREFLDKGYYEGFSNALNDIVARTLAANHEREDSISILDAGCGEGYYTWRMKNSLAGLHNQRKFDFYGIDVSKPAVHYASGRDKGIRFAIASSYHIPILKGVLDCILCIFAPRDEREFTRILKPSGKLIIAAPGPRHLYHLREALYESPELIGEKGTAGEGFMLLEQYNAAYDIHLGNTQDILSLFMMTPYSRHADSVKIESVRELHELVTEVDIMIRVYQKI